MRKVGCLLASLLALPLLAGCTDFSEPEDDFHQLSIFTIDVSAPEVATGSVVLAVNVTLDNSHGESGNVNLTVKAFDASTGLLVLTKPAHAGRLPADETRSIEVLLPLPMADGYRIDVQVYEDDRIVQQRQVSAYGLRGLVPNRHETGLSIDTIDFRIRGLEAGRASIDATVYLTNEGVGASRPLRMQVKAREVSTGLIADEGWLDVSPIPSEETRALTAAVQVPDDFNYVLEVHLWDGQLLVERGSGYVQLLPNRTFSTNQQTVTNNPDVRVFIDGDESSGSDYRYEAPGFAGFDRAEEDSAEDEGKATQTPGLGLGLLVAVLALAAFSMKRRQD